MTLAQEASAREIVLLNADSFPSRLARGQVLLVLVGFPLLYWLNIFTPWSVGLFGHADRGWYVYFFLAILILHWSTTLVTLRLVYRAGGTLEAIGLKITPLRVAVALVTLSVWGGFLLWFRTLWPLSTGTPAGWQALYPIQWSEKVLMLLVSATAGICEETIYRGFALRVLRGRGMALWLALLLAGTSFAMIHGPAGVFLLPAYLVAAGVFSGIFLATRSLWPAIYAHAMFDMLMVLAV